MTFTEAAAEVLRLVGKPLHYKEITELAIEKNLLSHVGKSPEVTMGARLAALLKKDEKGNPIIRVKPGVFGLRDWNGQGLLPSQDEAFEGDSEVNALEVEASASASSSMTSSYNPQSLSTKSADSDFASQDEEAPVAVSGEDALRANLVASGAELFDDEEDDDQPILALPDEAPPLLSSDVMDADASSDNNRRKRRRRRRGRGRGGDDLGISLPVNSQLSNQVSPGQNLLDGGFDPSAEFSVESPQSPSFVPSRPVVRDRQQIMGSPVDLPSADGEELAGKELADAAFLVLQSYDRNQGAVSIRSLADTLTRKGRMSGDAAQSTSQLAACLRTDNLKRSALGMRVRYRFASGGRVALTDWLMSHDLIRMEQEVFHSVERYREAARRMMLRRLQELPGQAFVEIALIALERAGISEIKPVKRPGSPGGEMHFSATYKTGSGDVPLALILRKDGREIGRERVSDARGTLHYYGGALSAWLITTGQVLSGAKEEANVEHAPPVVLYDGLSFCRFLEENKVGVLFTNMSIAIPDVELFESVRGI